MKILVFSDSHGQLHGMKRAVETEEPDVLIHLGDHAWDAKALGAAFPAIPLYCVCGNCDPRTSAPELLLPTIDGLRLFLTHGHIQGVKTGLERLYFAAVEKEAQLVLFGHTHRPFLYERGGVTLLNPGSIGSAPRRSYAVVDTAPLRIRHVYVDE